jgi:uncharacterized membrane protein YkoI
MMSLTRLIVATVAGLAFGSVPVLAAHHNRVVPKAKLRMQRARIIALEAYPGGRIMKEELEHEGGGSGLRYSFDMKRGKKWREIGVDAFTGKVLENKAEGTNPKD